MSFSYQEMLISSQVWPSLRNSVKRLTVSTMASGVLEADCNARIKGMATP